MNYQDLCNVRQVFCQNFVKTVAVDRVESLEIFCAEFVCNRLS